MTRAKICIGILSLLVAVSVFSSLWVNKRCDGMLSQLKAIGQLAETGQNDEVTEMAVKLDKDWEDFRSKASVLLKYDSLVEVDRICSRIVHLAENDSEELQSEVAELINMLEMMKSSETPHLNSVF